MKNGFCSALEICAKILREENDFFVVCSKILWRTAEAKKSALDNKENFYCRDFYLGFLCVNNFIQSMPKDGNVSHESISQ